MAKRLRRLLATGVAVLCSRPSTMNLTPAGRLPATDGGRATPLRSDAKIEAWAGVRR